MSCFKESFIIPDEWDDYAKELVSNLKCQDPATTHYSMVRGRGPLESYPDRYRSQLVNEMAFSNW